MSIELKIIVDNQGQLQVNGPITDTILCLGVLELAKSAIIDFKNKRSSNIVIPRPITPITKIGN